MSEAGNRLRWTVIIALVAVIALCALLFLGEPGTRLIPRATERPSPPSQRKPSALATELASGDTRQAVIPEGLFFSGRVIDDSTEEPIRTFRLRLVREERLQQRMFTVVESDVDDDDGRFSFPLDEDGSHLLFVSAENYREKRVLDLEIPSPLGLRDYEVRMATPLAVTGRVVDDGTNRPVEGATLGALMAGREFVPSEDEAWGFGESNKSDSAGRFVLEIPAGWRVCVVALHADYGEGFCETVAGVGEVEIRLQKSSVYLFGTVLDDDGNPAEGIEILIKGKTLPWPRRARSNERGEYRTPWLRPGNLEICASPEGGRLNRAANFTGEKKWITLVDEPLEVNFGPSDNYSSWRGTLFGITGDPLSNGTMCVQSDRTDGGGRDEPINLSVICDEKGRFEFQKLIQGTYKVLARVPGKANSYGINCGVITFDEPGVIEKDIHLTGAEVNGVVIDGETGKPVGGGGTKVVAHPKSASGKRQSATVGFDGTFCLVNLRSGTYTLLVRPGGPRSDYSGRLDDFRVADGQVIDHVRLVLERGGFMIFKITGIDRPETARFKVTMHHLDTKKNYGTGNTLYEAESWSSRFQFEPGNWILTVEDDDLGVAERPFAIEPGGETRVVVRGSDFKK